MTGVQESQLVQKKRICGAKKKAIKLVLFICTAAVITFLILMTYFFPLIVEVVCALLEFDESVLLYSVAIFIPFEILVSAILAVGFIGLIAAGVLMFVGIPILQLGFGFFSIGRMIRLLIVKKSENKKGVAVIFRVLTLIFGVASIVFAILFFAKFIPIYMFLRSAVLFFIGSIVLNIFIE